MSILIRKSGILSTIQDLGRKGFRQFGINPNGAMDSRAVRLINILLGNEETEAVLEMHFPAPEILFEAKTIFAVGGANFGTKLDETPIENWRSFTAQKGSVLKFEKRIFANRAYLSVKGGFKIERWLGSRSTNLLAEIGGFAGRSLRAGDRIGLNYKFESQNSKFVRETKFPPKISNDLISHYNSSPTVRAVAGAEFERLTALSEQRFFKQDFAVSRESNRMGFRLCGDPLYLLDETELISSAVDFGSMQLLPDGQIIVLMADHQTSGGYPRIAHVASADLPVLAQLGANDKVGFELISLQEAENLLIKNEKDLNLLRTGCNFKINLSTDAHR